MKDQILPQTNSDQKRKLMIAIFSLTKREREVVSLIGWGASAKEIGEILSITSDTVKVHIRNIKRKTGVQKMNEISAMMFIAEYNVPISDDKFGRLSKLFAMSVVIFLVMAADFMNIDMNRPYRASVRTVRVNRTARRSGRRSEYELTEEELLTFTA